MCSIPVVVLEVSMFRVENPVFSGRPFMRSGNKIVSGNIDPLFRLDGVNFTQTYFLVNKSFRDGEEGDVTTYVV